MCICVCLGRQSLLCVLSVTCVCVCCVYMCVVLCVCVVCCVYVCCVYVYIWADISFQCCINWNHFIFGTPSKNIFHIYQIRSNQITLFVLLKFTIIHYCWSLLHHIDMHISIWWNIQKQRIPGKGTQWADMPYLKYKERK